jgi:hypothetical protein
MALTRVRRGALPRCLAVALLLAGPALWESADAQYGGFGFPFFGNQWFDQRPPWVPPRRELPKHRQPREREPTTIATPPAPHKPDVAPTKTGARVASRERMRAESRRCACPLGIARKRIRSNVA